LELSVELLQNGQWLAIEGLFDPLTAAQAARIAEFAQLGRSLLVVVLDDKEAFLSAAARAELVASLREVNAVTIAKPGEWQASCAKCEQVETVRDLEGEKQRSEQFIRFILDRHLSAASAAGQKA